MAATLQEILLVWDGSKRRKPRGSKEKPSKEMDEVALAIQREFRFPDDEETPTPK